MDESKTTIKPGDVVYVGGMKARVMSADEAEEADDEPTVIIADEDEQYEARRCGVTFSDENGVSCVRLPHPDDEEHQAGMVTWRESTRRVAANDGDALTIACVECGAIFTEPALRPLTLGSAIAVENLDEAQRTLRWRMMKHRRLRHT
jgi:uncharacterized Zn finger protein